MTRTVAARAALIGAVLAGSVGCAQVQQTVKLQAVPLEKPRTSKVVVAKGFLLRGKRDGMQVVAQVAKADYCTQRTEQKARGFRVVQRKSVGNGMVMQWLTGGVLTVGGGFLFAQSLGTPQTGSDPDLAIERTKSLRLYGGGMALIGSALLAAAIVQTAGLGTERTDLGVRVLKRDGLAKPCNLARAAGGTVRLTLDGGLQLTAPVDETGHARITLPPNLDELVKRDGGRATLEVLGDWRSQRRIDVSRDGAMTAP